MIFIDSSVIVALLGAEPDSAKLAGKLEADRDRISAGHVILEASMRLATLLTISPTAAEALVIRLLREAEIDIVPINEDVAHAAVGAFERYGKGRKNRANLNFGDCLSYACAKVHGAKLLFKGSHFTHTDALQA